MNSRKKKTIKNEDARVNRQIDNIQNGTTHVTNVIKGLRADFKRRHFIDESDRQMILLQLIVSAITRGEKRPTEIREKPFKMNGDGYNLGDSPVEVKIHEMTTNMPSSWVSIRKCLVLVCAKVPSTECQERITEFMKKRGLTE